MDSRVLEIIQALRIQRESHAYSKWRALQRHSNPIQIIFPLSLFVCSTSRQECAYALSYQLLPVNELLYRLMTYFQKILLMQNARLVPASNPHISLSPLQNSSEIKWARHIFKIGTFFPDCDRTAPNVMQLGFPWVACGASSWTVTL